MVDGPDHRSGCGRGVAGCRDVPDHEPQKEEAAGSSGESLLSAWHGSCSDIPFKCVQDEKLYCTPACTRVAGLVPDQSAEWHVLGAGEAWRS